MRRGACAALLAVALLAPVGSSAVREPMLEVRARYLPPTQRAFPDTPEGWQARYDAARDLQEAVRRVARIVPGCVGLRSALLRYAAAHVAYAEAFDRPVRRRPPTIPAAPQPSCRTCPCTSLLPAPRSPRLELPAGWRRAALPGPADARLAAGLERIGRGFRGWAGFWVHDLRTGRTAGWNADARFPAASTVKLGAVAAVLARSAPAPAVSPYADDLRAIGAWSSNLGANRIAARLGAAAVADGLRRLGMISSTYPGLYRAGTATGVDAPRQPPLRTRRVTTARDLGRALLRLHAAAAGRAWARRQTGLAPTEAEAGLAALLDSRPEGDNAGLLRRWFPSAPMAQKHGWISDTRITAAIVYRRSGPVVVVVEAHAPGLSLAEAQRLAGAVALLLR
jgi:Beta-lactamase enzyme family